MKNIILDTDIGIDCDDAVALGLAASLMRTGKCEIKAVTCSTTREGAAQSADAILRYYGLNIPVGEMRLPQLLCDFTNKYAKAVAEKYGGRTSEIDSVTLMRKTLAESRGKVTIACIGPLCNMASLFLSGADEYSPHDGISLVKEKVDAVYAMAGNFLSDGEPVICEWNIEQDIQSAREFARLCPVPVIYMPHEVGLQVFTYPRKTSNPVWYAMQCFARYDGEDEATFKRWSWDPITCLLAIEGSCAGLMLSEKGRVEIDGRGITTLTPCKNGKDRYIVLQDAAAVESVVNRMIEE